MLRMVSSSSRLMLRTTTSVVHSSAVGRSMMATGCNGQRFFSADSHDDFKPKRTEIPTGMEDVLKLIKSQVSENDVMLYMKGTPSAPQCGFSGQAVRILNALGTDFASVNVLEYPAIRDGVKAYSEWPTIPQL